MPERRLISTGSEWEREIGYSRAVSIGEWVFVSGTTGYDYKHNVISADVFDQTEFAMQTIHEALLAAGAEMKDVVRIRYILPDRNDFPTIWPVLKKWLGDIRPAATMIQAGLMQEDMKIEIEVTARKSDKEVEGDVSSGKGPEFEPMM